jgi:hypothetical protein
MTIHFVLAFLLYVAVFFASLASLMHCVAISIRIGLWALLFSTVIIVISVVQTLEPQTAFLVLTYTCFVCWLQYTITKHTVSAITYFSDQCWRTALFFWTWMKATSNEFRITLLMSILLPFLTNGNAAMYEAAQNGSDFLQILYAGFEAL